MTKLSDTQLILLSSAAKHDEGVLTRPAKSHPPALAKAVQKLLSLGLIRRERASPSLVAWGDDEDGNRYVLCITREGLDAIGVELDADPANEKALAKQRRVKSKRATKSAKTAAPTVQSQRPGSKLATVVDMLRAPDGVSLTAIMTATDWQAHSVRGAIAGAIKKKLGLTVVSERRGDERFYRIAG